MARHFVLGTWANADEFDYSGEQLLGHRQGKSICMDHMLPNGMANLKRYGDPVEQKPKAPAKTKSVLSSILLADRNYERLSGLSEKLDEEFDSGQIDLESWAAARKNIDQRLHKAWLRVCKERNWQENEHSINDNSLTFDCNEWQHIDVRKPKHYDFSIIPESSIFYGLSDENSLKKIYTNWLQVKRFAAKIWAVTNEIITEGLI